MQGMIHAFLIIGMKKEAVEKELESRISAWKISSWDTILIPEEGTVGIEMIRDFERELVLLPRNSPAKVGVLTNIDRATPEAQNALLKTIEEPPPHTYIIGTTSIPEAILPTIRSRMSTIRLKDAASKIDASYRTLIQTLLLQTPGQRLQTVEKFTATRDEAKNFVTSMLSAARDELLDNPSPKITTLIRNLLEAQSQLSVNVNQKLVVDNAVLHIG